ncbi:hypothetical protein A0H81_04833 [Grifola frondosa]|uniref:Uncharacterized protein n=1 Tax=Grifola frondosa TaxID=5627 RepID=A0A1C7MET8_GRIFR|nr:hypothetical protein A0H81_04833 [Grifola frondosa]
MFATAYPLFNGCIFSVAMYEIVSLDAGFHDSDGPHAREKLSQSESEALALTVATGRVSICIESASLVEVRHD